jgi:hypothetical protein
MDKAKVIAAYLNGFITLKECEQILGIESSFILTMASERMRSGTGRVETRLERSAGP